MRERGKDGEDETTLSIIQLFDNWGAGVGKEIINLTRREKRGGGNQVSVPIRAFLIR